MDLEEQVLVIAVPPAASQHRPDVAVDRLDLPEGDRLVAVADDAVQVAGEQVAELLEAGRRCQRRAWSQWVRKRRAAPS